MDVVSKPGGEYICQVGGSRGGVGAGARLGNDVADLENKRFA